MKKLVQKLSVCVPPLPGDGAEWQEGAGERVVLLHGLWRSVRAMRPMADFLAAEGFETVILPYRSFIDPIPEIVASLQARLAALNLKPKKTHFVTHSLGGIVLRRWLAERPDFELGRVVMLAPPSQGSEIIDWLEESPLVGTLGPAGRALSTARIGEAAPAMPPGCELGILMGSRATIPFFQTLLEERNDGIVSLEKGRLPEACDFRELNADHTFFAADAEAQRLCARFLRAGKFD